MKGSRLMLRRETDVSLRYIFRWPWRTEFSARVSSASTDGYLSSLLLYN